MVTVTFFEVKLCCHYCAASDHLFNQVSQTSTLSAVQRCGNTICL